MGMVEVYLIRINNNVPVGDAALRAFSDNMNTDDEVFRAALKISKPIMDKDKGASWWCWKLDKKFVTRLYKELGLDGDDFDFLEKFFELEGVWYMVVT
jgi:hypothetical protein